MTQQSRVNSRVSNQRRCPQIIVGTARPRLARRGAPQWRDTRRPDSGWRERADRILSRSTTPPLLRPWRRTAVSGIFEKYLQACRTARERIARIRVLGSKSCIRGGGHPLTRPDYRQYALECLRLAGDTNEPSTKAVLIDMAQSWVRLAEQAQRNRRLELLSEMPSPVQLPAAS